MICSSVKRLLRMGSSWGVVPEDSHLRLTGFPGLGQVWPRFVYRFRAPLVQFASARGIESDLAEEVAQETLIAFLAALRENKYDRGKGRLRSFLFGIASNKIRDALRKAQRGPELSQPETGYFNDQALDEPSRAQWEQLWERSLLRECLRRVQEEVTESTWRAIQATALEERDPAEVADELGLTRNAVFVARHRVTTRLRRLQTEQDDEPLE